MAPYATPKDAVRALLADRATMFPPVTFAEVWRAVRTRGVSAMWRGRTAWTWCDAWSTHAHAYLRIGPVLFWVELARGGAR